MYIMIMSWPLVLSKSRLLLIFVGSSLVREIITNIISMPLGLQWHPFTYSRFEDRTALFQLWKLDNSECSKVLKKMNIYVILEKALLTNILLLYQNFTSLLIQWGPQSSYMTVSFGKKLEKTYLMV